MNAEINDGIHFDVFLSSRNKVRTLGRGFCDLKIKC